MKHHLNILQSNIRLSIQETIVDYRVNHDITGKVYEVKPLVFELPKIAQQLILGKKPEEMVSKIDALGNLIQLMLPFGIVEQVPFLHEELKEIIANIDRELKVQRINKEELFLIAEKESLESYILYSFMDPVHFSSTFEEV